MTQNSGIKDIKNPLEFTRLQGRGILWSSNVVMLWMFMDEVLCEGKTILRI